MGRVKPRPAVETIPNPKIAPGGEPLRKVHLINITGPDVTLGAFDLRDEISAGQICW